MRHDAETASFDRLAARASLCSKFGYMDIALSKRFDAAGSKI